MNTRDWDDTVVQEPSKEPNLFSTRKKDTDRGSQKLGIEGNWIDRFRGRIGIGGIRRRV